MNMKYWKTIPVETLTEPRKRKFVRIPVVGKVFDGRVIFYKGPDLQVVNKKILFPPSGMPESNELPEAG